MSSAPQLVDTRLLAKPQKYSNNKAEWTAWKFSMYCYIGAVAQSLLQKMQAVEAMTVPLVLASMTPEEQMESRTLMFILSGCLAGSAIQLAMNVESFNGLECWRLLVQREEPSVGSAQVATLTAILRIVFSGDINKFE